MTEEAHATAGTGYKSSFSAASRTAEDAERRRQRAELPRYGGSSFSSADRRPSGGAATPYRLASLDRLAHRHQLYATEQTTGSANGDAADHALPNKREQFFSGKAPPSAAPPPVPKETPPAVPGAKELSENSKESRSEVARQPDSADGPAADPAAVSTRTAADEPRSRQRPRAGPQRRAKQLDGYVGFASLPDQVYRRAVRKGFHFTLMVVGESGLGKSTLVNSMFMSDIYNNEYPGPSLRIKKTVAVDKTVVQMKENGVNLSLTVVDTPGFGDAVDNSNCWQPVIEYIESRYEEYLNAESRVHRCSEVPDSRVHCCLYFIAPSGHGLKPLDVEFMKRLHDKVNIVPVIAKADTMTPEEITSFKRQILSEIAQHKIRIYEFPDCPDDEEEAKSQAALRERVPFAVVGANTVVEVDGKRVRGRRYPWGVVQIESMEHSDFIPLRNMLIRTHMMDLIDVTSAVHYENYRCRKLAGVGSDNKPSRIVNKNPLAQMEEEKRDHELKMKKMEAEMEQVFEMKVKEKRNKLKESEDDLERREQQMLAPLDEQRRLLEERRAAFRREQDDWERQAGVTVAELRQRQLEAHSKETVDGKKKKKGLF